MKRIGIICAMSEELKLLKDAIKNAHTIHIKELNFYVGTLYSQPVVLVKSGIGKVQAGATAAILIANFNIKVVIHSGSAGGIGNNIKIGDLIISTGTVYHDVDVTAAGYKYGQLPDQPLIFKASPMWENLLVKSAQNVGIKVKRGLIVSGDQFVSSNASDHKILKYFPTALACEMEGAAVGQIAHWFHVPYVVIRAMSDNGNDEAEINFKKFLITAGKRSAQIVLNLCKDLQ